jgi:hypothetical protein
MTKVVVIGGGKRRNRCGNRCSKSWRGSSATGAARPAFGIGRIAGSMDVGGRYPLHLEILEMGAPEVNEVLDEVSLDNMDNYRASHYPWHSLPGSEEMTKHSWIYNVLTAEPALRRLLKNGAFRSFGAAVPWTSKKKANA